MIDLTKILKDCSKGTKFYSSYLGKDVLFIAIYDNCIECEYSSQIDSLNCIIHFKRDGSLFAGGECMLFPSKDQRDWSKWYRPFVDGDVVTCEDQIAIFKKYIDIDTGLAECYVFFDSDLEMDIGEDCYVKDLATEEEKQKLFKALEDNGYMWNADTKTLEKLIVPKFKVGDTIRSKNGLQTYNITNVTSEYYSAKAQDHACIGILSVKDQDDWILIPNKFNPKSLQPFDKVLVRDDNNSVWVNAFFGFYDSVITEKYPFVASSINWAQCIPYEGNEHLLGTFNQPSEFYRYWED